MPSTIRNSLAAVLILAWYLSGCSSNPASPPEPAPAASENSASSAAPATPDTPAEQASQTAIQTKPHRGDAAHAHAEPLAGVQEDLNGVQEEEDESARRDAQLRELVIGTWEDDYQGRRTMTLQADGTGIMVVELSGLQATLFASRLEFNMRWSLEDGRLKKQTIDGKPAKRVEMILKMMGDRVDEPILELTETRLLLLDQDGETRYDWRRKAVLAGGTPGTPTSPAGEN